MASPGLTPGGSIPDAEAGARLTVDLGAIIANWRSLAARAPHAECAAVVKADAYGTGIETTVPTLARAGCRTFFVAHLSEAKRARAVAPGAVVYVLNGLLPGTAEAYAAHDLRPVLGSPDEIAEWTAFLGTSGWSGAAALHVDTGMTRLGLDIRQAAALSRSASLPPTSLLMSHFSCADEPKHPLNARQIAAFAAARQLFPGVPASLANSSGLFLPGLPATDLLRPGAALYGVNPTPGQSNPMEPVVTLEARVIMIREAPAGASVGYGATWTCDRPTRLAILHEGYADGFFRTASGSDGHPGGEAIVAGRRCPIAGRISMDLMAIDVSALPEGAVGRGTYVELIGPRLTVDEVGHRAGTIGYEVLTSLGRRYHRHIIG